MSKIKYQIFVSSTYEDLKEERDQVIKACLEMGHIPVGMEMFSAADEEQWQIITRQIDESDYYVVIVANRYGSIVDGISFTEKEYDYAVSKGVPTLGFVLDPKAGWPTDRLETDKKAKVKLDAFKKKVKDKPVNFWTSKEDLHGKCAIALMKTFNTKPRPGWVRSTEMAGPEVTSELSRLSSENATLRSELEETRRFSDTSGFAQGEDVIKLYFAARVHFEMHAEINATWNELFWLTGRASLINPVMTKIGRYITDFYAKDIVDQFTVAHPDIHINVIHGSTIYFRYSEELEMIGTQFLALNLIQITHSASGEAIWKLTTLGERQYAHIAARKRGVSS